MTYMSELGYKVGDRFEMVGDTEGLHIGDVVELFEDDGSEYPLFKVIEGSCSHNHAGGEPGCYLCIERVSPITPEETEEDVKTVEVGDRVVIRESSRFYLGGEFNPYNNVEGTVTSTAPGCLPVKVLWDTNQPNSYNHSDLQKVDGKPLGDGDTWILWNGGKCPVEEGTLVDVRLRDGQEYFSNRALDNTYAGYAFWRNDNMSSDIVAYRLHKDTPETPQEDFDEAFDIPIGAPQIEVDISQEAADNLAQWLETIQEDKAAEAQRDKVNLMAIVSTVAVAGEEDLRQMLMKLLAHHTESTVTNIMDLIERGRDQSED